MHACVCACMHAVATTPSQSNGGRLHGMFNTGANAKDTRAHAHEFAAFADKHSKSYANADEHAFRRTVWAANKVTYVCVHACMRMWCDTACARAFRRTALCGLRTR